MLHVPVIHSSHSATFTGLNFPTGDKPQTRTVMGATQIIDECGNVICRLLYNEASGIISSDVQYNTSPKKYKPIETQDYWILKMPAVYLQAWKTLNPLCEGYYQNISRPYYRKANKTLR